MNVASKKEQLQFILDLIEFRKQKRRTVNLKQLCLTNEIDSEVIQMIVQIQKLTKLFDSKNELISTILAISELTESDIEEPKVKSTINLSSNTSPTRSFDPCGHFGGGFSHYRGC